MMGKRRREVDKIDGIIYKRYKLLGDFDKFSTPHLGNFMMGLLVLMNVINVKSEQCALTKSVTSYYPYCNNVTRTADYELMAYHRSQITCNDTIYQGAKISVTSKSELQTWATGDTITTPMYLTGFFCTKNSVFSEDCQTKCGADYFNEYLQGSWMFNTTTVNCTGDSYYCLNQLGVTTNCNIATVKHPECYCTGVVSVTTFLTFKAKGSTYCKEVPNQYVGTNVSEHDFYNIESATYPVREFTEPYIEFDGQTIYARTKDDCNCYLQAKKDNWSKISAFIGSEAFLRIDDIALIKSGILYVTIVDDDGQENEQSFNIRGNVLCRLHDCVLCSEAFTSFHCLPSSIKIVFWVSLALIILLTLCACPMTITILFSLITYLFKGSLYCCKLPMKISRSKAMKKFKNKLSNIKSEMLEEDSNTVQLLDKNNTVIDNMPTKVVHSSNNTNARKPMNASKAPTGSNVQKLTVNSIVLLMLLPFTFASPSQWGCSEVENISTQTIYCTGTYPNRKNCSTYFEEELVFDTPMTKLCRQLIDEKERVIGYLEVSLIQVEMVAEVASMYYTSDYTVTTQSSHHCWLSDYCNGIKCEADFTNNRNASGALWLEDLNEYSGTTYCRRGAGCAANGCVICADGCIFSGYAVIPQGDVYHAYEPIQMTLQPLLLINYTSGSGFNKVYNLQLNSIYNDLDMFSLNIEGDFVFEEIDFEDYKVFSDGRNHYLNRGNEVNKFDPRIPGDIQANIPDFHKVIAYDKDNFVYTPQGKEDVLKYPTPGIKNLLPENQLPRTYAGYTWVFDTDGKLRANKTDEINVRVKFTTSNNFTYNDYVSSVCPRVNDYQASGCYNCDLGSNVNITMKSICSNGIVYFSVTDPTITLKTTTAQITTNINDYLVEFLTTEETNAFDLLISGSSSNTTIHVNFTAVSIDQVNTNQTYVSQKSPNDSQTSGWGSWRKFFDDALLGKGHWLAYLIIGTIVSIVVIVILKLVMKNHKKYTPLLLSRLDKKKN